MERTPGASSSLCVCAKNRHILVHGEWYVNRSRMGQHRFAIPSTHTRIWFANHSAHSCIRGFIYTRSGKPARALHKLFIRIWEDETVPNDFKDATVVNVYKRKGDRADCTNYCGISLLCVAGKIPARIIMDRLLSVLKTLLPESQVGFRPNRYDLYLASSSREDSGTAFISTCSVHLTLRKHSIWSTGKLHGGF